ncbi:MAG: phosphotransferase [Tenericutes bacterium HGW-Tenericutes-3]|nr:MAG: phosphotransferase [Tenericutes bacterium HGW-Tenericutes-3]
MKEQTLIKKQAAKAFHVKEEEIIVKHRFLGGMSHLTYLIEVHGELYSYRIIGKDGNLFVDRKIEFENINLVKPLNINNETVYFDVETGEKAAHYVEGEVLSTLDFRPHLNQVAKLLKKLHTTKFENAHDYGLIKRLDLYETYTDLRSPLYLELKNAWIQMYQESHVHKPKVFCHNDAQRSNMVIGKKQIYLLDWEYAGLNEFYYDIASFGNVKFEDALELLDAYLERKATIEEINSVRFYRMFQALQWHQVALRKEMIGLSPILKIDFKFFADKYLELANRLYLEIKG